MKSRLYNYIGRIGLIAIALTVTYSCSSQVDTIATTQTENVETELFALLATRGSIEQACRELDLLCASKRQGCNAYKLFCAPSTDQEWMCLRLHYACRDGESPNSCSLFDKKCQDIPVPPTPDASAPPSPDSSSPPQPDAGLPPAPDTSAPPVPDAAPPPPSGTVYYAAPSATGSGAGTLSSPWTLAQAAQNVRPGDTVYLRGGTYNGPFQPARSGSASAGIRYVEQSGETAIIQNGDANLILTNVSYVVIEGLTFRDPVNNWARLSNAHHNRIHNCLFTNTLETHGSWNGVEVGIDSGDQPATASNYNLFSNSKFERWADWATISSGPNIGVYSASRYNLFEGNTFVDAGHANIRIVSPNNIVRRNTFRNAKQKNLELANNPSIGGGNLVEYNDFGQAEYDVNAHGGMHLHTYTRDNIVRFNTFHDANDHAIDLFIDSNYNGANYQGVGATGNRFYSNTLANNGIDACTNGRCFTGAQTSDKQVIGGVWWPDQTFSQVRDNVFKNNIIFDNHNYPGTSSFSGEQSIILQFYKTDGSCSGWQQHVFAGNLIMGPSKSTTNPIMYVCGVGFNNMSWFNTNQPSNAYGNIQADPMFTTYQVGTLTNPNDGQYDFRLRSGSPAINAGVDLTTTTTAGSGTQVTVRDAKYFHSGYGGMIPADEILIGTQRVRITAIDYATNRITVDRSISWSAGAPVNLPYTGSRPDMGAVESG